jgi:hypothetical protein
VGSAIIKEVNDQIIHIWHVTPSRLVKYNSSEDGGSSSPESLHLCIKLHTFANHMANFPLSNGITAGLISARVFKVVPYL